MPAAEVLFIFAPTLLFPREGGILTRRRDELVKTLGEFAIIA